MHRIWVGLDPRVVLSCVGTGVTIMVLVMHLFAFKALNWPGSISQKYPAYHAQAK
jgi:hypothetical protein